MSYIIYNDTVTDIIIPTIFIPIIDLLLCSLFGTKARWFQLHSVINAVIVYIISEDIIKLYTNPIMNNHKITSTIDYNFIIVLHIYHLIISKNVTFMDYFHHILFVGGGCIPACLFYNNNLMRLSSFAGCGLTGSIEYLTLALVKHNRLESLTQKKFNAYIYNYLRYPFTLYSVIATHIVSAENPNLVSWPIFLIYTNILVFLNGSFYNKLTIENYVTHKMVKNNNAI